jgi:hypothetical protein
MAGGGAMPVTLAVGRSSQSGLYTLTAAFQAVYSDADSFPFVFYGGTVDLTNEVDGDVISIRIRKMIAAAGAWITVSQLPYIGLRPVGNKGVPIPAMASVYGLEVSMIQTLGAFKVVTVEWFPAKRP